MRKQTIFLVCLVLSNTLFMGTVSSNPYFPGITYLEIVIDTHFGLNLNESNEYYLFPDIFEKINASIIFDNQLSIDLDFSVYYTNSTKFVFSYENYTGLHYDISYFSFVEGKILYEVVKDYRTNEILIEQNFTRLLYNPLFIFSNNNSKYIGISIRGFSYFWEGSPDIHFSDDIFNWWFDTIIGIVTLIILSVLGLVVFFFGSYKLISFVIEKRTIKQKERKKLIKELETKND